MADDTTDKKRIIKTGYNDRLYNLGLSQGSLAGYVGDPYQFNGVPTVSGNTILVRRDDILITEAGAGPRSVEHYMRLFNDSAVISAWEKLVGEIIARKWEVFPASDSDKDEETTWGVIALRAVAVKCLSQQIQALMPLSVACANP